MTKRLYVARRTDSQHVPFRASPEAVLALAEIKEHYSAITGKTLSTSIIVRRALEVLAERLAERGRRDLTIGGDAEEAAAVLRHVR